MAQPHALRPTPFDKNIFLQWSHFLLGTVCVIIPVTVANGKSLRVSKRSKLMALDCWLRDRLKPENVCVPAFFFRKVILIPPKDYINVGSQRKEGMKVLIIG